MTNLLTKSWSKGENVKKYVQQEFAKSLKEEETVTSVCPGLFQTMSALKSQYCFTLGVRHVEDVKTAK